MATHLIVADGHRRVQEVAYLSQVLKAFCLQLYPLTVRFLHCLVNQRTHFLDLGDCKRLKEGELIEKII